MQQLEYRAAIALNNMAVTMMERRCYRQAFETFKDAVTAMKLSTPTFTGQQNQSIIFESLKKAHQRSSHPVISSNEILLTIVSLSHHDARPLIPQDFSAPSSSSCCPMFSLIRIDDVDLLEDSDKIDSENGSNTLATLVTIYNFGIANLCRAHCLRAKKASASQQLLKGGLKLLTLSCNLLLSQYEDSYNGDGDEEDFFTVSRLLFILTVLLKTLCQTFTATGQGQDAASCRRTLAVLRTSVTQEPTMLLTTECHDSEATTTPMTVRPAPHTYHYFCSLVQNAAAAAA